MHRALADAHHPNLRFGKTGAELVAGLQLIAVQFVQAALDVDGGELALVGGLELRADVVFVNGVATPRELFLTITASDRPHEYLPFSGAVMIPFSVQNQRPWRACAFRPSSRLRPLLFRLPDSDGPAPRIRRDP